MKIKSQVLVATLLMLGFMAHAMEHEQRDVSKCDALKVFLLKKATQFKDKVVEKVTLLTARDAIAGAVGLTAGYITNNVVNVNFVPTIVGITVVVATQEVLPKVFEYFQEPERESGFSSEDEGQELNSDSDSENSNVPEYITIK